MESRTMLRSPGGQSDIEVCYGTGTGVSNDFFATEPVGCGKRVLAQGDGGRLAPAGLPDHWRGELRRELDGSRPGLGTSGGRTENAWLSWNATA
jgi:hypothetical protein